MKNPLRWILILQLLFFTAWTWREEKRLHSPQTTDILLETLPVDPRDLFSGQYMALRYKIGELENNPAFHKLVLPLSHPTVWVLLSPFLKNDGLTVYRATQVSLKKPAAAPAQEYWVKGKLNEKKQVIYGIERWYFSESRRVDFTNALVSVLIGPDGAMRIKKVIPVQAGL